MRHLRFEVRNQRLPHPLMGWLDLSPPVVMCLLDNGKVELCLCDDERAARQLRAQEIYSIYLGPDAKRAQLYLTSFTCLTSTPVVPGYLWIAYEVFLADNIDVLVRLPGYVRNPEYRGMPCQACGGAGTQINGSFMELGSTVVGPCSVCKGKKVQP